MKVYALT